MEQITLVSSLVHILPVINQISNIKLLTC